MQTANALINLLSCAAKRGWNLRPLYGFKATGANVIVYYLALRVDVRYLLNVGFKSPSRSSLGMAHVVAGSLTLSAYAAYSRHKSIPPIKVISLENKFTNKAV